MNKRNITLLIIVLLVWNVILTVLLVNNNKTTQTITEENVYGISTDLTKVAQSCYSSVVEVKSMFGSQTGFIYKQTDDKTYIVTTFHGIGNDNVVSVIFANNKTIPASVVGFDYLSDVAVLAIDSPYKLNVVKCGDNEYTSNGEFVICIGANDGVDSSNDIELGIISNQLVNVKDVITYQRKNYNIQKEMISLSLNSKEGYSGSPIFNMKNEVIGMIQMNDNKKTYSITINELKIIVDNIINKHQINKLDLGVNGKYVVYMEDYERNMLNISFDIIGGYYVNSINPKSIASKLGINPSDIILSINNVPINNQKDLLNILYSQDLSEISCLVYRNSENVELKGTIND